jgi:hypothetical protein
VPVVGVAGMLNRRVPAIGTVLVSMGRMLCVLRLHATHLSGLVDSSAEPVAPLKLPTRTTPA